MVSRVDTHLLRLRMAEALPYLESILEIAHEAGRNDIVNWAKEQKDFLVRQICLLALVPDNIGEKE